MMLIIIDWDCLKQDEITFTHGTIVNICIVYEISSSDSNNKYFKQKIIYFWRVKLTKNAGIDKYKYSGYRITFDRRRTFWFPTGQFGCNVITVGVHMSYSVSVNKYNNKKKQEKIYFNPWWRSYARVKWYSINYRKKLFH